MKKSPAPRTPKGWSDADRQAFADGVRTRATTIPNKKRQASKHACRRNRKDPT